MQQDVKTDDKNLSKLKFENKKDFENKNLK